MAKYRVYLKDGKGIFDVEADCFDNPFDNPAYIEFSKNESTVACFERETIYAIINKNGALRIDENEPIAINGVVSEEDIKFPYIVNYYTAKEGDNA